MANRDLASGWLAWLELWQAKTYAMARLMECTHSPLYQCTLLTVFCALCVVQVMSIVEHGSSLSLGSPSDAEAALLEQMLLLDLEADPTCVSSAMAGICSVYFPILHKKGVWI